jgi:hypothetical protein
MSEATSAGAPPNSYHCLCTTLILITTQDLQRVPRRNKPVQDGALILAPPVVLNPSENVDAEISHLDAQSILVNTTPDRKAIIIRREDGFDKRTLLRCLRCKLSVGYTLDESHWEDSQSHSRPVYLLPGGLLSTAQMAQGEQPEVPPWGEQK